MDVPAHVTTPAIIQNHIQVQSGTNWDLSRGAVETPITQLKELPPAVPTPAVKKADSAKPFIRIHFTKGSAALPHGLSNYLAKIPKGSVLTLGVADSSDSKRIALVSKRKSALATELSKMGYQIKTELNIFSFKEINEKTLNLVEISILQ